MNPIRRLYWFAYHAAGREARHSRSQHQVRDGAAFAELALTLGATGHEYAGLLLNIPSLGRARDDASMVQSVRADDLMVLTTRPPMDDTEVSHGVSTVSRSETGLERSLFATLRAWFFERCSRSHVELSDPLADSLSEQRGDLAHLAAASFRSKKRREIGAGYDPDWVSTWETNARHRHAERRTTAGYLAFLPPGSGLQVDNWDCPGVLAVFGLSGLDTLSWAHFLASRDSSWLRALVQSRDCRFVLAEWQSQQPPPRARSLAFLDDCVAETVLAASSPAQWPPDWSFSSSFGPKL